MSRRAGKTRRSGERPRVEARPSREAGAIATGRTGWKNTILFTALALVASVVFFWQILRETGFLSAISGAETRAIRSANVFADFDAKFSAQPVANKHRAVKGLLGAVVDVDRGKLNAGGIVQVAREVAGSDSENRVSRLALAYIVDSSMRDRPLTERFEAIRQIMEAQPPAAVSRIYKRERQRTWYETLAPHIKRADVRVNLTGEMDLDRDVHEHFAALPVISSRLAEFFGPKSQLAEPDRAKCRDWLVRTLIELIQSEPDSGTRLLCAELASKAFEANSPTSNRIGSLVSSFKVAAVAARPDLTDMMRAPTPCPAAYRKTIDSFAAGMSIGLAGLGSAICCLGLALLSLIAGSAPKSAEEQTRSVFASTGLAIIIATTIVFRFSLDGPFSEIWVLLAATVSMMAGVLTPIVLSISFNRGGQVILPRRRLIHLAVCLLAVLMLSIPPSYPSWWGKKLGGTLMFGIILTSIFTALIVISVKTSRVSMKGIARSALRSWAVLICLSVVILAVHQYWDNEYLSGITAARMDEVSARLGPDWENHFLADAKKAVGMTGK